MTWSSINFFLSAISRLTYVLACLLRAFPIELSGGGKESQEKHAIPFWGEGKHLEICELLWEKVFTTNVTSIKERAALWKSQDQG